MSVTLSARLRRLWLNLHLWIGVGLLAAFVPIGVSGAAITWDDELGRLLHPHRFAVSRSAAILPASAYLAAADRAFDGRARSMQLAFPERIGDPVQVLGQVVGRDGGPPMMLAAWLDPATAAVQDVGDPRAGVLGTLHKLHKNLLIPKIGRKVVGWVGWCLLVSCMTGLWLWWPRKGGFVLGLRWRRGASQLFNLHHAVGFWICLPLSVLALTGVYLAFPATSLALFGRVAPPAAIETRVVRPGPVGSVDAASAAAAASVGGASPLWITLPADQDAPAWAVQLAQTGRRDPFELEVSGKTGEVRVVSAGDDGVSYWAARLHEGQRMPLVWRSILTLAGLAPLMLAGTGLFMWLGGRARRSEMK